GNVIAFNGAAGVAVAYDSVRNPILGNSIHANAGLGIDLNNDGPSPPDPGDGDTGPNLLQNAPVLAATTSFAESDPRYGRTIITGTLDGPPGTTFRLAFFSSTVPDPTGYGEGQTFLGADTIT